MNTRPFLVHDHISMLLPTCVRQSGAGTLQKDWTIVKSYELREAFCIAVVGHEGWNNDPDASVPYSLVISFEAINAEIPVYTPMAKAQIELEIQEQIKI